MRSEEKLPNIVSYKVGVGGGLGISSHFGNPHLVLQHLICIPATLLPISFLLIDTPGSRWVSAAPVGDLESIPSSWFWPSQALTAAGIWGVN